MAQAGRGRSGRPGHASRGRLAPAEVRASAGLRLARTLWGEGDPAGAMDALSGLYRQFPAPSGKPSWQEPRARLEAALFKELAAVDDATLRTLAAPPGAADAFPYTVVELERLRRLAGQDPVPAEAWNLARRLSDPGLFANPSLPQEVLGPLAQRRSATAGGVVLALPLSGQYANIGWKILRGAGAAHWDLAMAGNVIDLRVINTDAPGWLDELAALPPEYRVVGGPLRAENLERMHGRGLTSSHPVFAFMPQPGSLAEGQDVWRFFTGPGDQVRSLVSFAVNAMGIRRMAILHPEEPFGKRLSERFWGETIRQGAIIGPVLSYPPKDPTKWAAKVSELLDVQPPEREGEEAMPPEPGFDAVFLPDGWSQAQLLVPQFFFYDEDRLLLMGPSLWGQGLESDQHVEGRYFRLAIFPSAFAPTSPSPGTAALQKAMDRDGLGQPDFWVALGYDFLHFAGAMGPLPGQWTPGDITAAARRAQSMQWSMAPMAWDEDGLARQDLFLMQPTDHGAVPVDPARLLKRRDWIIEKHDERVETMLEKRELQRLLDRQEKMAADPNRVPDAPLTPEQMRINARVLELQQQLEQRAKERGQGETQ